MACVGVTWLAGTHVSCPAVWVGWLQSVIKHYDLRSGSCPQTYALGIKEVWEVPEEQHKPGLVIHTLGYPLGSNAYGGGFLYHMEKG
jgi:electron-transferring-flavoprotein dehydrogenase